MDVFEVFETTPYKFLELSRGGVTGDTVVSQTDAGGVFKLSDGMTASSNQETKSSNPTLHIRADETFTNTGLVGHGIKINNIDYEIIGVTGGDNYHDGQREHYRATLKPSDFASWSNS